MHVRTPGGGGWGDPMTRAPEAVAQDVRLGRYTAQQAEALFGVILHGSPAEVDVEKTANRRADPTSGPRITS